MSFSKKIKRGFFVIAVIVILAGIAGWFIGSHTLIQTEKEYVVIEKPSFGFENNYFDVREWSILEYIEHPEIAQALIAKGYKDIQTSLEQSEGKNNLDEALQKTSEALKSIGDRLKQ